MSTGEGVSRAVGARVRLPWAIRRVTMRDACGQNRAWAEPDSAAAG